MNEAGTPVNDLTSLLYVSRSELPGPEGLWHVREMVDQAVVRNHELSITGALIYTELHFAQILEGPVWSVKSLMSSIRRDYRHRDVRTVQEHPIARRVFGRWSMAYDGPAPYLDRQVKRLLNRFESRIDRQTLSDQLVVEMRRHYAASFAAIDSITPGFSRGSPDFRRGANLWEIT